MSKVEPAAWASASVVSEPEIELYEWTATPSVAREPDGTGLRRIIESVALVLLGAVAAAGILGQQPTAMAPANQLAPEAAAPIASSLLQSEPPTAASYKRTTAVEQYAALYGGVEPGWFLAPAPSTTASEQYLAQYGATGQ